MANTALIDITEDGPDLYVSEAAAILRMAPHTVYRLIDNGELPAQKYPGAKGETPIIRIERAELRAFKARHRVSAAT